MTATTTPRLGLRRWSADTDTWSRAEFDTNNAQREAGIAVHAQGAAAARPAAGVAGRFYYATDVGALFYDTGTAWNTIQAPRAEAPISYINPVWTSGSAPNPYGYVYRRGDRGFVHLYLRRQGAGYLDPGGVLARIQAGYRPAVDFTAHMSTADKDAYTLRVTTDGNITALVGIYPSTFTGWAAIGPYPAEPLA